MTVSKYDRNLKHQDFNMSLEMAGTSQSKTMPISAFSSWSFHQFSLTSKRNTLFLIHETPIEHQIWCSHSLTAVVNQSTAGPFIQWPLQWWVCMTREEQSEFCEFLKCGIKRAGLSFFLAWEDSFLSTTKVGLFKEWCTAQGQSKQRAREMRAHEDIILVPRSSCARSSYSRTSEIPKNKKKFFFSLHYLKLGFLCQMKGFVIQLSEGVTLHSH